jgi:hypothetical protein
VSSSLITDYLGSGLHSARPVTPTPPSGGFCMYYETDTGNTFAWNGTGWIQVNSSGVVTPAVVQVAVSALGSGNVSLGATFAAFPTTGNLLIGVVSDFSSSIINGTGWTPVVTGNGATNDGFGWGYKIAGASEPKLQTPSSEASNGAVVVWEVNLGCSPGIIVTLFNTSATAAVAYKTVKANQLVIGACNHLAAVAAPTMTNADHHSTVTGTTRTVTYWDFTPAATGAHTTTAVHSSSGPNTAWSMLLG